MDTFQAIFGRRSIRKFTGKSIPEEDIKLLLRAGMAAPTARNTLAWEFLVVDDKKLFNEIQKVHPYSSMLNGASNAILVCGNLKEEDAEGYNAINTSAVTQNILLAAHDMGLGTCWIGLYPREERVLGIRKIFNIPEYILPVNLVAVGYPDEVKQPNNRYLENRVHFNKW